MNGAKVKRCVLFGPVESINNKNCCFNSWLSFFNGMSKCQKRQYHNWTNSNCYGLPSELRFLHSRPLPTTPSRCEYFSFVWIKRPFERTDTRHALFFCDKAVTFPAGHSWHERDLFVLFLQEQQELLSLAAECWIHRFGKHLLLGPLCPTSPFKGKKKGRKYVKLQTAFWQTSLQVIKHFVHSTAVLLLSCAYTLEKSYGTIRYLLRKFKEAQNNISLYGLCWGKKHLYQQGCQWVVLVSVLNNLTLGELELTSFGEMKVSS